MNPGFDVILPPERLALSYAKGVNREILELLLVLNTRLADIGNKTSEPLIAQMRVAWWNDVIAKPADIRPKGEPLLQMLSVLETHGGAPDLAKAMLGLVEAWSVIFVQPDWTQDALTHYADAKSDAVFGYYARLTNVSQANQNAAVSLGRRWALDDLLSHCQTSQQYDAVITASGDDEHVLHLPRALRALSILARTKKSRDKGGAKNGLRLIWHALTGL